MSLYNTIMRLYKTSEIVVVFMREAEEGGCFTKTYSDPQEESIYRDTKGYTVTMMKPTKRGGIKIWANKE